ncbi:MAG: phosphatase PAP2 family protein [Sphingobacteriales bacterium]|nr:MAG: phosphatase PAP2 family protein [Sphingobacteriales bacterium]
MKKIVQWMVVQLLLGTIGTQVIRAQTLPDSSVQPTVQSVESPVVTDTPETIAAIVIDSLHDKVKRKIKAPIVQIPVTARSLIIPGVMFGYGALAIKNGTLQDINGAVKRELWDKNPREKGHQYEDYFLLAPAVMVYGLNFAGYKGHNNIVDRSIMYGMANLISNGIVFGLKEQEWELRPAGNNYKSFPSGHTAQAFVSAEFARLEYRGISPWPGLVGYAFAVGAGFLRMYNNEHWLSDVIAGAGVGIVSTRFAYFVYPAIKKKLFKAPKIKGDAMLLPTWNGGNSFGLQLSYLFP